VEDPRLNYTMGDVVMARIVNCQRRRNRNVISDDDENMYYYHLTLSLKTVVEKKSDPAPMEEDGAKTSSGMVPLAAGSILEAKRIKVLQLVNCLKRDDGMFLSGYAVVAVKSKFFSGLSRTGDSVDFKLPYDHLLDSYGDKLSNPPVELDDIASKYLTVGKKIDAEGLILSVPKGMDTLPIISLRPELIDTMRKSSSSGGEGAITCPSPTSNLFMGEYIRGYVCRIDERFGAFVRFLDGLTGLIPKLKKGLHENLYDTILCKVTALDITSSPPKILLKKVHENEVTQKSKKAESRSIKSSDAIQVGETVDVKIADINFARATVYILGKPSESKSRARIHVTLADSLSTKHKLSKKEKRAKEEMKIGKSHPFYK
jgi:predicted RNA-binding protein with RPS1 domain